MFSYVFSSATSYFHLPIDEDQDLGVDSTSPKYISWTAEPSATSSSHPYPGPSKVDAKERQGIIKEVLSKDDLYQILGIKKAATLDKIALRRAYLARSKACHPDKFPNNPDATYAFQKVAVAYDVLSKPSSKRLYDTRSSSSSYDVFAARPANYAEDTFRNVVISIFNDFLDGDLEVIRTLLKAINDINPSLKLSDDGINSVLVTLQGIRDRALSCRTCIYALHAQLTRVVEVQHAFRQLSYFDLMGRSRLTIQLTRITLSLPIALERAMQEQRETYGHDRESDAGALLPRRVTLLIRGVDVALERMERILK